MRRRELQYGYDYFWGNDTDDAIEFDSNLQPVEDVSVDAVLTAFYYNVVVFAFLMASYECLRKLLPAVYSSKKRLQFVRPGQPDEDDDEGNLDDHQSRGRRAQFLNNAASSLGDQPYLQHRVHEVPSVDDEVTEGSDPAARKDDNESISTLPDNRVFDWIAPVFGVSWNQVRKKAGLDGYFFLRYIRMCVRITSVSTFWFFLILVPVYYTGSNPEHAAKGWYHLSATNIPAVGWRMWMPVLFNYLFTSFIIFVMKQEYRHFLEIRQDFLARGSAHVNPQHHYSLMVENIPYELRSERALHEYFEKLFPGKVHSTSIVMKVPDLEEASMRCLRTCRRLEKSIAFLHATGKRPTHIVGRGRLSILGVEMEPFDLPSCHTSGDEAMFVDDEISKERTPKGTRVDSISYYTQELATYSKDLFLMQERKNRVAESGRSSQPQLTWFDGVVQNVEKMTGSILEESIIDNDLSCTSSDWDRTRSHPGGVPQAEHMTSKYGSFSAATLFGSKDKIEGKASPLLDDSEHSPDISSKRNLTQFQVPFASDLYRNSCRRILGRLGLDYLVSGIRFFHKQLDVTMESVNAPTMSSTGFVTFLDLTTTTCAASAPLTVKTNALKCEVAPEPRQIRWVNAHVSQETQHRREKITDFVLFIGLILWSFPLAAIQAFAKAEYLAQIPGFQWILAFHGGTLTNLVNGYLPVVALLTLVCILPVIFEAVATRYERRKTFSDVQSSMLARYFNFQIANVYVSVTAGSILKSLAEMLDHPSSILELLGESLPTMVGYFIALLVTKIMAGLPLIFLRFGALSRMLMLRILSSEKKLTQRELDWVYRLENIQYGWEFPSQLLVIVIVFSYAIMAPIILPFGMIYFTGALIVYKKQLLFVYSPVYESGGAMFPMAVQRTLFGLVCGQLTFLGYTIIRGCYYQPIALLPLPVITIWVMRFFEQTYAIPSSKLSLERARDYDTFTNETSCEDGEPSERGAAERRKLFDRDSYRQPVLTEMVKKPWMYRRGFTDAETVSVQEQLNRINRYSAMMKGGGITSSKSFV